MKKVLLSLFSLIVLQGYVNAQIKIGSTTYPTLPDAIGAARGDDVITIAGPVSLDNQTEIAPASGETRTIKGITSDARIEFGDARFIVKGPGKTVFQDITLVGFDFVPSQNVGAMFVVESDAWIALTNDTIRGAITTNHGGAFLVINGAKVEATNTVFRDNTAGRNGGVFFFEGGNSSSTFTNCLFLNNRAGGTSSPDAKGGAISRVGGAGSGVNLYVNTAFIGNSSSNHAGAFASENSNTTFVNCTFSKNSASNNGGAIWMFGGDFSTILINSTIYDNEAGDKGAGIFMNQSTNRVELRNSVVANNKDFLDQTAFNISLASTQTGTITAKNSYFHPLETNVSLATGSSGNLTTGALHLADVNLANRVYWNVVSSDQSVLVNLGDPALLAPYTTDQRGATRNAQDGKITAGAYEFGGVVTSSPGLLEKDRIAIYPNPAASGIIILKSPAKSTVAIFDVAGTLIGTYSATAGENVIDISGLTQKVYILKSTSADGVQVARFVKQ